MIFASFLNFINLWADTCFLSTLQTRRLMLSKITIYPSSGKWWRQPSDAGMCDPDLCNELCTAAVNQQDIQNGHWQFFLLFLFCKSPWFFFSFGNCVSSALCADNSGEADPHPQGPGMVRDQGRTNQSVLTLCQSPWLVDGCVTDLDQEGQWDAFLGLLMRIGKKTGASSWLGLLF